MRHEGERLGAALKAVADADAGRSASAAVEERLRHAVRARAQASRRVRRTAWLGAAAAVVATAALWWLPLRSNPPATAIPQGPDSSQVPAGRAFLPLPYAHVPASDGRIVRMEVSGAALAAFGLEPIDVEAGDIVLADVFVGEDGLARAVRFVTPDELLQEQTQ